MSSGQGASISGDPLNYPDIQVNKDDLRDAIRTLDTAGADLFKQAKPVQTTPDCGKSSGETAEALAALAAVVGALSERFGVLKDAAQNALDSAIEADEDAAQRGHAQRRGMED